MPALHVTEFRPFKLIEKENLSHDVVKFKFALNSQSQSLGIALGQHVSLRYKDEDGKVRLRISFIASTRSCLTPTNSYCINNHQCARKSGRTTLVHADIHS